LTEDLYRGVGSRKGGTSLPTQRLHDLQAKNHSFLLILRILMSFVVQMNFCNLNVVEKL
jgi:hypothetical protein